MALNQNKDLKVFFSIGEVAKQFGVSETLLRFWEQQFPTIKPRKAGRGVRQYTKKDIEAVRMVYHLVKERGMTLEGARSAIKNSKNVITPKIELIEHLKAIKKELQAINREFNELT